MARTTVKRKSEGTLPSGKPKYHRAISHGDESAVEHEEKVASSDKDGMLGTEDLVAPKHTEKNRTRKPEPVYLNGADEYEEDEGRTQSQQFLNMVEIETRKKREAAKANSSYLNKFTCSVKNDEQVLKKKLHELGAASTKHDVLFLEEFTDAFKDSRPNGTASEHSVMESGIPPEEPFQAYYQKSLKLISNARSLVDQFEAIHRMTTDLDMTNLVNNNWELEDETMAQVLETGRAVGIKRCKDLLGISVSEDDSMDLEAAPFAEAIYKPEKGIRAVGWGKIARKQEKAAQKILKILALEAPPAEAIEG